MLACRYRMNVLQNLLLLACLLLGLCRGSQDLPAVYFTLERRGGPIASHDQANLTALTLSLYEVEKGYARSKRTVEENRLVRKWSSADSGTVDDLDLLCSIGDDGKWFFNLATPEQQLVVDLDMLSPDFYISMTTSDQGSRYNSFANSHVPNNARVHPLCRNPSDSFDLPMFRGGNPGDRQLIVLDFAMCSPSKSSRFTLLKSGSVLGLAPPSRLTRITSPTLLQHLLAAKLVTRNLFSVTLLDWNSGLLTIGSAPAYAFESARVMTELELNYVNNPLATPGFLNTRLSAQMEDIFPAEIERQFAWSPISGAIGHWMTLMPGVWITGSKILKNQPVLLDINCPFILAPPLAARRFYESIGGAKRLPEPHDMFFGFPCHNAVNVAWEFGMTMFPAFRGGTREETFYGPSGGRFSLGKLDNGSGYCVGVVVETRMGLRGSEEWRDSGMKNVWVLGEPFFRGIGVTFDIENGRMGFRAY